MSDDDTRATATPASLWMRLLAASVVVGVLAAAVGLVAPKVFSPSDASVGERADIVQVANDFAMTYNTYDVSDAAGYQKRMKGLLTPSYDKEFVKVTDAVFSALSDRRQQSGDAKVLGVAVDSLDKDSATALVAVDASISNTDNKVAVARHFRWKLSFQKVGTKWKVDNFETVTTVEAATGPAPTPTAGDGK